MNDALTVEYWAEDRQLIVMMAGTNTPTSSGNLEMGRQVANWNQETKLGRVSDSNGGFTFPGNSTLIPDLSFMTLDRVDEARTTMAKQTSFYRGVPQFVIELFSSGATTERIHVAEKMTKYMNYGVDLGWVVDPFNKSVIVYRRKPKKTYEVRSFVSSWVKLAPFLRSKFSTTRPLSLVKTSSQALKWTWPWSGSKSTTAR